MTKPFLLGVTALTLSACGPGDEVPVADDIGQTSSAIAGTAGALNLWDDASYTDTHIERTSSDSTFTNNSFNDKASSVVNRTGDYWRLYMDSDYSGYSLCIRPYSHVADLKNISVPYTCEGWLDMCTWNDKISSVKRLDSSAGCGNAQVVGAAN